MDYMIQEAVRLLKHYELPAEAKARIERAIAERDLPFIDKIVLLCNEDPLLVKEQEEKIKTITHYFLKLSWTMAE